MRSVDEEDRRLWSLFVDAGRMVFRHLDRDLRAELNVIGDDVAILDAVLAAKPSGIRISDVAHRLAAEPRHATYRIERLEKMELVERRPDLSDGRALRVHPTGDTETFYAMCRKRLDELIDLYLLDLITPEQRAGLVDPLTAIVDGYRHHLDGRLEPTHTTSSKGPDT